MIYDVEVMTTYLLHAVTVLEAVVERLSTLHEFSERSLTEELKAVSSTLHITHKSTVRIFRASVIGLEVWTITLTIAHTIVM